MQSFSDICQNCSIKRVITVSGKTSDCFFLQYKQKEYDGYVPENLNIDGGSDYIEFAFCADCGTLQGKFPIKEEVIEKIFNQAEGE